MHAVRIGTTDNGRADHEHPDRCTGIANCHIGTGGTDNNGHEDHQSLPWGTTTVFRETMWKWSDDTLVLRVGVGPDRVHEGVIQISLSTLAPGEPSDCYRA